MGGELDEDIKSDISGVLIRHSDSFASKVTEIVGVDPRVASHSLNINLGMKPVIQKKRKFAYERQKVITEETKKLLDAGFIREVTHPEWVANVVLVKKANGKYVMCVDYTDLNKSCPKDSYPLPTIDQLVDSTTCHRLYSFIDAAQGYHQIPMKKEGEEKTSFITHEGLYCYKVMPFGLKKAGAIYQRLMNHVFQDQIGKMVEVYVDDIIVKSQTVEQHAKDLEQILNILDEYQIKLNLDKCVFGVKAGKFLGFMISHRGIEANPEKMEAILNMRAPKTLNELQKLNGRITTLRRFILCSAKKCLPLFRALKHSKKFEWSTDCQKAFEEIQKFLTSPPLLSKPVPEETLYLYLSIGHESIASVLVREEGSQQSPVYYVSKILRGPEIRYPKLDKLTLIIVYTSKKLQQYFQANSIVVRTNFPLRKILQRPETSG